jgi:uncharacterized protein YaaN involved in tellurite resistance
MTVLFEKLSGEDKRLLSGFIENINLQDVKSLISYAKGAEGNVIDCAKSLAREAAGKNAAELRELYEALDSFCAAADAKSLIELFGFENARGRFETLHETYLKLEKKLDGFAERLRLTEPDLIKKIAGVESVYKLLEQRQKELSLYIVAGEEKLRRYNGKTTDSISKFQSRIENLKDLRQKTGKLLSRIIAVQNNDRNLIERINAEIINALAEWKSKMRAAFKFAVKDNFNTSAVKQNCGNFKEIIGELINISNKTSALTDEMKSLELYRE